MERKKQQPCLFPLGLPALRFLILLFSYCSLLLLILFLFNAQIVFNKNRLFFLPSVLLLLLGERKRLPGDAALLLSFGGLKS